MKKILIIYTAAGHGHKKLAENIAYYLKEDYQVDLVNLFRAASGRLIDYTVRAYSWIVNQAPWFWDFLYNNKYVLTLTLPLRTAFVAFKVEQLLSRVRFDNYDIIISTQFSPSAVVSYLIRKGLYHGKFVVGFSDFHLHPYWLYENVDLYLANIVEQKDQMLKMGIPERKIAVCGMTLQPTPDLNPAAIRKKMGIPADVKVVLLLSGSMGYGIDKNLIRQIGPMPAFVIAVCGNNVRLHQYLSALWVTDMRKLVLGYVDNMQELYAIADIAVTKPGGLTTSECLAHRLPILVHNHLPGQEKLNLDYLYERNLIMPKFMDISSALTDELKTVFFRAQLRENEFIEPIVQHGQKLRQALADL